MGINLVIGALLGIAHLLIARRLSCPELGIVGLVLELLVSAYSSLLAIVLFPCWMLYILWHAGKDVPTDSNEVRFYIRDVSSQQSGKTYVLTDASPSLEFGIDGRDVQFPNKTPGVSHHHCQVVLEDGRAYLIDLNSTYGTFILSPPQRLQPMIKYELRDHADFCLASRAIQFRCFDARITPMG